MREAPSWYRQRLQVRVVGAALVASALVVALVGVLLVQQVGRGLLDSAVRQGVALTNEGLVTGQTGLEELGSTDRQALREYFQTLVAELSDQSAGFGALVVAVPSAGGAFAEDQAASRLVPERLQAEVAATGRLSYTFTTTVADVQPAGNQPVQGARPFLVVGGPLQAETEQYQLFYLLPLDNAADTYSLVQRTVYVAGASLVLLLVLIAYLLSRQVVAPVRAVAQSAERIAGGLLEERVPAEGEDELARLALSFNAMAASLQAQIAQLEELSRLQRRFVSDVSHELRTPLTTVRMAADLLHVQRDEFPPATARAAELLQDELDRFERLLGDLLEISRFDAAAAVLEREPTDLAELVLRSVERLRGLAAQKGSSLDTSGVPEEPVVAEVDRRRIDRILRNLLSNALEYGEGSPVEVAVGADETAVAVTVRDHGRGFAPDEVERLFDRFWRADPSRKRNSGGTGLGLSIAAEDARLHGGRLEPWGRPDEGAVFRLTLPRRAGLVVEVSPLPLEPEDADEPVLDADDGAADEEEVAAPGGAVVDDVADAAVAVDVAAGEVSSPTAPETSSRGVVP